jgi:hypothetical protein
MGPASAKVFGPAFSWPYFEDTGKNKTIRDKDSKTGHNYVDVCYNENLHLIDIGAGAWELEQWEDITEIVVDGVWMTENQSQDASSVDHGSSKCHQVWTKYKVGTNFRGQGSVTQK